MENKFDSPKGDVLVADIDTQPVYNTGVRAGDTFEVVRVNEDHFKGDKYFLGAKFTVESVSDEDDVGAVDLVDGFCLKPPDSNGFYHAYGVPVSFKSVK